MSEPIDLGWSERLRGTKFCLTGKLFSLSHEQVAELIQRHGGRFLQRPRKTSFSLVVGDCGWPAGSDPLESNMCRRARQLRSYGYRVEFLSEPEFLARVGLRVVDNYTVSELAALLGISESRILKWVKQGLIQPRFASRPLQRFDLGEVARVKRLFQLQDAGYTLPQIRQAIAELEGWLPEQVSPWQALAAMERRHILFRVGERLVDERGQFRLDFEPEVPETLSFGDQSALSQPEFDELWEQALRYEEATDWDAADAAYEKLLAAAPSDPVLNFNAGNVAFQRARLPVALERYRRAVELAPEYAEAWNNLGNVLFEHRRISEAIDAYETAVRLAPDFADAHANLATVFRMVGRLSDAARHRQRSLAISGVRHTPRGNCHLKIVSADQE